ncbi:MAG: hypothetical protein UY97_C0001G0086 [Parcubacteria group bacterium GW2011_GWB1_57_6]|nr:MAG: hypothetical protein UY93_C0004G0044 [Parcubacteria group bacterium GW2011_GWA1_56_13]KKW47029.1 MAG: hypothetical protein UY97_C0001G0086 [Parcubacteria group bacterium GW2011_GWB1_57_6]
MRKMRRLLSRMRGILLEEKLFLAPESVAVGGENGLASALLGYLQN